MNVVQLVGIEVGASGPDGSSTISVPLSSTEHTETVVPVEWEEPLRRECRHFAACVRDGRPPRSDGASGRRVVAVLEAACRSLAADGAPMDVDAGAAQPSAAVGSVASCPGAPGSGSGSSSGSPTSGSISSAPGPASAATIASSSPSSRASSSSDDC